MSSRRRSHAEVQLVNELVRSSGSVATMSTKIVCIWIVGLMTVVLGILAIAISNSFIRKEVIQRVMIVEGSEVYPVWKKPELPIYLQVYVWDLLNPDLASRGEKPILRQKGPYTYREILQKVNITHNTNGTVTYRQNKYYHFIPGMSNGSDSDTFTSVNIPLITLANAAQYDNTIEKFLMDYFAKFTNEKLFIKKTVCEVVWGYHDRMLAWGQTFDPKRFTTDFVGVLVGHNATDDGLYTIYTGESDITKLGDINKYNGSHYLPFWSTSYANMVNGTDGSLCPPFVQKDWTVRIFLSDICRSVYINYHDDIYTRHNIQLYRFQAPRSAMESADLNPDNAGFCTPYGNCMGTGVLNMSTCQKVDGFHIPVVASYPHFFMADDEYISNVTGMHPDARYHTTDVDIEPTTGIVMEVAKRMQINIQIDPVKHFDLVKNVRQMVYPVLWINESFVIDDAHALQVKNELLIPKMIVQTVTYTMITLGGLMAILAAGLTRTSCDSSNKQQKQEEEEEESERQPTDIQEDPDGSTTPNGVTITVSGDVHHPPDDVHVHPVSAASINGDVLRSADEDSHDGDDEEDYGDDDDDTEILVFAAAPMAHETPSNQRDQLVQNDKKASFDTPETSIPVCDKPVNNTPDIESNLTVEPVLSPPKIPVLCDKDTEDEGNMDVGGEQEPDYVDSNDIADPQHISTDISVSVENGLKDSGDNGASKTLINGADNGAFEPDGNYGDDLYSKLEMSDNIKGDDAQTDGAGDGGSVVTNGGSDRGPDDDVEELPSISPDTSSHLDALKC